MMDHKDFPQMTEEFDRRVRQTLEALPEQPQRARRFPMKRIVSAGLAAALCLGGLFLTIKLPLPDPMLLPILFTAVLAIACIALYLLIRARAEKWAAAMH